MMNNNSMMPAGDKRIVPGPKVVNLKTSRSLIISPNLDALLEYDEKIRRLNSPISSSSSHQLPLSTPVVVGLPPPPRRTSRKPKSPTSPIVKSPLVQESSHPLECENPYINPAPVFEFKDELEPGAHGTPKIEVWSANGPGEPCPVAVRDVQKEPRPLQDSKERVEKTQQLHDVLDTAPTQRSNLRDRARTKGKLLKLKETVLLPGSNNTLVMDIRRQRPFISRRRSSPQGSTSSSSRSSTSTYEPASTIDNRISISSTMYPTSTVHSPSIFVDELPIVPPDNSSLYSDYLGRHSFIDIITPAVAEFTLPPSPPRTSDARPTLLPTIPPKPDVGRLPTAQSISPLSAATNFLDLDERSDLIRQNRKLAKVFGKPPGPNILPLQNKKTPALHLIADHKRAPLTDNDHGVLLPMSDINTRSHSVPLSVHDDFLCDHHDAKKISHHGIASSMSFIDLSDDLGSAGAAPTRGRHLRRPSPSLIESVFPEEQAEEARRLKREKLARLHRFLGSRVPINLVLGPDTADPGLPPLDPTIMSVVPESRKDWLRRRRSSSAAAYSSTWSDEIDRIKEDLNSAEKAINVRRAQKMEKVFGVAPPQTLYHTRRSPSPSVINPAAIIGQQKSISGWTSPGESQLPVIGLRNVNRSSYSKKKNKDDRPGTSESDRALLPRCRDSSKEPDLRKRTSAVYMHYQDSLNSLIDIIDRDDKESLAELHEYLNSGDMSVPPPHQASTRSPQASDRRLSNASIKSERRRSLPARTSISSEYSIVTPRPDVTDFQTRRRRAAKLAQFFGVNYRELIKDVLESIESGLEHERKHGTLDPEEVEDLLARLRKLRTKRTGF